MGDIPVRPCFSIRDARKNSKEIPGKLECLAPDPSKSCRFFEHACRQDAGETGNSKRPAGEVRSWAFELPLLVNDYL